MLCFSWNKAKKQGKETQRHKQGSKRKQERERERERQREWRGGGKKLRGRNKGRHWKTKKWPFFGGGGGGTVFSSKNKRGNKNNKENKTQETPKNQEGLGPSEVALRATLNPPKNKTRIFQTTRETPKYPKTELFNYQSKFSVSSFFPKEPFLTTWPKKRATPKNYKKRGFSRPKNPKQLTVTKGPLLDKKNQTRNSSYLFFFPFLLFEQNHKICWHPIIIVHSQKKKRGFKNRAQNREIWKETDLAQKNKLKTAW